MAQVTMEKLNYMTVVHSSGFYEDDNNIMYPFSVEVSHEDGDEEIATVIIWDDDIPENQQDIETEILDAIANDDDNENE